MPYDIKEILGDPEEVAATVKAVDKSLQTFSKNLESVKASFSRLNRSGSLIAATVNKFGASVVEGSASLSSFRAEASKSAAVVGSLDVAFMDVRTAVGHMAAAIEDANYQFRDVMAPVKEFQAAIGELSGRKIKVGVSLAGDSVSDIRAAIEGMAGEMTIPVGLDAMGGANLGFIYKKAFEKGLRKVDPRILAKLIEKAMRRLRGVSAMGVGVSAITPVSQPVGTRDDVEIREVLETIAGFETRMADGIQRLADAGTKAGAIFVDDVKGNDLLVKLLEEAKVIARASPPAGEVPPVTIPAPEPEAKGAYDVEASAYYKDLQVLLDGIEKQMRDVGFGAGRMRLEMDYAQVKEAADFLVQFKDSLTDTEKLFLDTHKSAGTAESAIADLSAHIRDLSASLIDATANVEKAFLAKAIKDSADKSREILRGLRDDIDDMFGDPVKVELAMRAFVDEAKVKAFSEHVATMDDARARAVGLDVSVRGLVETMDNLGKADFAFAQKLAEAEESAAKEFAELSKRFIGESISKGIEDARKQLARLSDDVDEALKTPHDVEVAVKANVSRKQLEALRDYIEDMDNARAIAFATEKQIKGLDEAMSDLAKNDPDFAARMAEAEQEGSRAIMELANSTSSLKSATERARGILELFNDDLERGAEEAKRFAGGLGVSGGALVTLGVATAFAAKKLSDFLDSYFDAAKAVAQFSVNTAIMEDVVAGGARSLDAMRKGLGLTKQQADSFFAVVRDGVTTLGMSREALESVALSLQRAFGGDPTERLRDYIDLLKEIPTLGTDLAITASMDDKAAAIFALAQQGKVGTMIEMQMAGELGGIMPDKKTGADLLTSSQRSESHLENIRDSVLKYFPTWGPQLTNIVKGVTEAVGVVGVLVAGLGAFKLFYAAWAAKNTAMQVAATTAGAEMVTAAVLTSARLGGKVSPKAIFESIKGLRAAGPPPLPGTVKAAGPFSRVLGGIIKPLGRLGRSLGSLRIGVSIAASSLAALGVVAQAGGVALDKLGDSLRDSDNDFARLSGAASEAASAQLRLAAAALAGVAAGMAFGPLGGVLAGVAVAAANLPAILDSIGDAYLTAGEVFSREIEIGGEKVKKYSDRVDSAGKIMTRMGKEYKATVLALRQLGSDVWKAAKDNAGKIIGSIFGPLGIVIGAYADKVRKGVAYSDEFSKKIVRAADGAKRIKNEFDKLEAAESRYVKLLSAQQKGVQKSALALQTEMEMLKRAVNSAKFALIDFRKELADLQASNIGQFGGSTAKYLSLLGDSADMSIERFENLSKTFEARRRSVMANTGLEGEQRLQMLQNIAKEESAAVKTLVESMKKAADDMMSMPKRILAEAKASLARAKMEIRMDVGMLPMEDMKAGFAEIAEEGRRAVASQIDAVARSAKLMEKTEAELAKVRVDKISEVTEEQKRAFRELTGFEMPDLRDDVSVQDAANKVTDIRKRMRAELDNLAEGLTTPVLDMASRVNEVKRRMEQAGKNLSDANKELAASESKSVDKRQAAAEAAKKANEAMLEVSKEYETTLKQFSEAIDRMTGRRLGAKAELVAKDILSGALKMEGIAQDDVGALLERSETLKKEVGGAEIIRSVLAELAKKTKDSSTRLLQFNASLKKFDKFVSVTQIIDDISSAVNGNIAAVQNNEKMWQELRKQSEDALWWIDAYDITKSEEVQNSKRILSVWESDAALAAKISDAAEEYAKANMARFDVSAKELRYWKDALANVKKQLVDAEERLATERKLLKVEKEGGLDTTSREATLADLERQVGKFRDKVAEFSKNVGEAAKVMGLVGDAIDEGLRNVGETVEGRIAAIGSEFGDAMSELAGYSDDFAALAARSFKYASESARKNAAIRRRILDQSYDAELKRIEEMVAAIDAAPDVKERKRTELLITAEAKKRSSLAKIEADRKKEVADAAEREMEIQSEIINIRQEAIDAEIDFISDMGGHFSAIAKLQGESLANAQEQYELAAKATRRLREMGIGGERLMRAETRERKLWLDMQRKAVGIQRDIFEKILGKAFGEIRTSTTGRRQRMTDVGLMGIERTRIELRSGLLQAAEANQDNTIEARALARQIQAWRRESTGPGSMLGEPPERLPPEEQMAEGVKDTATNTAKMAKSIETLVAAGTTAGSLYTADEQAYSVLVQILAATKLVSESIIACCEEQLKAGLVGGAGGMESVEGLAKLQEIKDKLGHWAVPMDKQSKKETSALVNVGKDTSEAVKSAARYQGMTSGTTLADISSELKANNAELQAGFEEFKKLREKGVTGEPMEKVVANLKRAVVRAADLDESFRRMETRNPVAGAAAGMEEEFARIMAGMPSKQAEEVAKAISDLEVVSVAKMGGGRATFGKTGGVPKSLGGGVPKSLGGGFTGGKATPRPAAGAGGPDVDYSGIYVAAIEAFKSSEEFRAAQVEAINAKVKGNIEDNARRAYADAQRELDDAASRIGQSLFTAVSGIAETVPTITDTTDKSARLVKDWAIAEADRIARSVGYQSAGDWKFVDKAGNEMDYAVSGYVQDKSAQIKELRRASEVAVADMRKAGEVAADKATAAIAGLVHPESFITFPDVAKAAPPAAIKPTLGTPRGGEEVRGGVAVKGAGVTASERAPVGTRGIAGAKTTLDASTTLGDKRSLAVSRGVSTGTGQEFFGAGGVAGGVFGGTSQAPMVAQIKGEILVKFDNKILKDQMAAVMGQLIATPEISRSIQKSVLA